MRHISAMPRHHGENPRTALRIVEYWFDPTIKQPECVTINADTDLTPEQRIAFDNMFGPRINEVKQYHAIIRELKRREREEQEPSKGKPALGKRPRIKALLTQYYPDGVPDPAHRNRQVLQGRLLKADPTVAPLDIKTLKTAIDEYNDEKRSDGAGNDRN